jgi:hypothetical protein
MFRGTICSIDLQDYLVRKINGLVIPEVEKTKNSLETLRADIEDLIKGLWWHDFELLIDLVFSKSGWQRFSVLGKTEKDSDLDVYSPQHKKERSCKSNQKLHAPKFSPISKPIRNMSSSMKCTSCTTRATPTCPTLNCFIRMFIFGG